MPVIVDSLLLFKINLTVWHQVLKKLQRIISVYGCLKFSVRQMEQLRRDSLILGQIKSSRNEMKEIKNDPSL